MEQQQRSRNVGPVGITDRDRRRLTQVVDVAGRSHEVSQLARPDAQVLEIEDALRQTAEEPRHAVLQHLPPRAKERCSRSQRLPQRKQVVLVAAGTVQQEQRRGPWCGSRPETMNEAEPGVTHLA